MPRRVYRRPAKGVTQRIQSGELRHERQTFSEEMAAQQDALLKSQKLLEASTARYTDLFDFAPTGFVLLDRQGTIVEANLTFAGVVGLERQRLVGYPFSIVVARSQKRAFLNYMLRCRRGSGPVVTEIDLHGYARDTTIPVELTTRRMTPMRPELEVFQMAVLDLRERRRAEDERRRVEDERRRLEHQEQLMRAASEAKDRFIAILSHELRTPLTPIVLALASLEREGVVPPALGPTIAMVRRNVELEARLIDDLLDVSRIAQGKLRLAFDTVDLHGIIDEVVGLCADEARQAGIRVAFRLAASAHYVRGDATRLRQVVWNLLRNAIRYTPGGGTVSIESCDADSGRLAVAVTDTGAGIPRDMVSRVFLPFEQAGDGAERGSGLGLGLAICKGIVDAHGGTIAVASDGANRGATFTIELATVPAVPSAAPAARQPAPRTDGRRVLLVEDNRDNAEAIGGLLAAYGYKVTYAGSVAAALRQAEQGFDVLVSDIGLPDGTGRDLVRQLCTRGDVRAIALTGYGTDQDVRRNSEAGFARHLTKPVDPAHLLTAIAELVDDPPRRAGANGAPGATRR